MDTTTLLSSLDRFQGRRILCVGDIMLDRFIYGTVNRVSAEAPIPILNITSHTSMLGGAGNVARNVAALGGQARLVGVVGNDANGRELEYLADRESGLDGKFLTLMDRPTTVKSRYIANGQQLLRTDEEIVEPLGQTTIEKLLENVKLFVNDCDVVLISDYAKGVFDDTTLQKIIALGKTAGKPILVDPKRDDFTFYSDATVLTPNRIELGAAAGRVVEEDEDVVIAAKTLSTACNIDALLVTRSERGVTLVAKGQKATHVASRALEVFDVSGAGDTIIATLAVALASGASLKCGAHLANTAAGVAVGKIGTAVVSCQEIALALIDSAPSITSNKVVSDQIASQRTKTWRDKKLRIGFTNGCFDLLHAGHVKSLNEARTLCDRLVVGINSDETVARLKGPNRPVQSEAARASVLAAMSAVDLVVVFNEETPIPLLEELRPDVLIKGGDYTIETVVGAALVIGYGGKVCLTGHVDGYSSSEIISRVIKAK